MGGLSSERRNTYAKKRIVEDCWILDLAKVLITDPAAQPPGGVLQTRRINHLGETPLPIRYTFVEGEEAEEEEDASYLDITYPVGRKGLHENVKERIELLRTRPNYGGARWSLSCPLASEGECRGDRLLKLYLPPGERRFGCRKCHDLTYESSQQSGKYDGLYALWAGGEREGEIFEYLNAMFSYLQRRERKRRAEGQGELLEAFEDCFRDYLIREYL
jgi:hypothetical protein